jgi:hypothetical protein
VLCLVALALPGVELELHECFGNAATAFPQCGIRDANSRYGKQRRGRSGGWGGDLCKIGPESTGVDCGDGDTRARRWPEEQNSDALRDRKGKSIDLRLRRARDAPFLQFRSNHFRIDKP